MATYKELQEKIEQLQTQAEQARVAEIDVAVSQIRAMMDDYGITVGDLQQRKGSAKKSTKNKSKDVQFRDGENTWSGRGRMPGWMAGKDKEKFRVSDQ